MVWLALDLANEAANLMNFIRLDYVGLDVLPVEAAAAIGCASLAPQQASFESPLANLTTSNNLADFIDSNDAKLHENELHLAY